MECLSTTKSLKINIKREIGTVVIFVEGAKDEFTILKHIFRNLFHYHYIEKSRNKQNFKDYDDAFVMEGNKNSRVFVINLENSNIKAIKEESDYKDAIFRLLYEKFEIDITKVAVYFIWDRDNQSNQKEDTLWAIEAFSNAYENKNGEMNGLLLLSYPKIESFVLDNFEKNTFYLEEDLKKYIKKKKYEVSNITKETLKKSVIKLHNNLRKLGIVEYDTTNFENVNKKVFSIEEGIFEQKAYYKILSFVVLILIDLNIIEKKD